MESKTQKNLVLFNHYREIGYKSTWKGFKRMALYELAAVSRSMGYPFLFENGLKSFFGISLVNNQVYEGEDLTIVDFLYIMVCRKLPEKAVNHKKCDLIWGLIKKFGIETFTTPPTFTELVHELLHVHAEDCDCDKVAKEVLIIITRQFYCLNVHYDEIFKTVCYLIKHSRGININDLSESEFSNLIECIKESVLRLCFVSSTAVTKVFLDTPLDATKMNLLWRGILKRLPTAMFNRAVEVVRSFVGNGFDVTNALYAIEFIPRTNLPQSNIDFNHLLEILKIFMENGARLDPLPGSSECSFLYKVLFLHHDMAKRLNPYMKRDGPSLLAFIKYCIQRGFDPKLPGLVDGVYDDLLLMVCRYYNGDDMGDLVEFLCDCGMDESFYLSHEVNVWSELLEPSSRHLFNLRRLNETALTLIRKGFRPHYIDSSGRNLLQVFCHLYSREFMCGFCRFDRWHHFSECKCWNVLEAILDAGVTIDPTSDVSCVHTFFLSLTPPSGFNNLLCPECEPDPSEDPRLINLMNRLKIAMVETV